MMNIIDNILSYLYFAVEKLKGIRTTTRLIPQDNDILNVKVKTIFDYKLEITVIRTTYHRTYSHRYFRSKQFYSFDVVGKVDENAPASIKEAFNKRYTFPKMMPSFVPLERHLERAVSDYMDMVIQNSIRDQ